ncbi:TolC family protein [Thiocapsa marina]|uniref:Outer membrane efflux protein n=1 Tax=Thiocapsa marina 5811 TaxID=768671 RepID=F9UC71_9GAMM|nr:TolC family protein [Thiocapsa marina]EGV17984.1 outer membrane efflux protein [Thiocapsa marina 5811]
MSRPLLIIPLIGLLLTGAGSAAATTLAEAVGAALALAEQTPRVTAARREADAIRTQAGSLVAQDPALRVKYLSDELTEGGGANEWEAMVDLPLWLPGQRGARREVAGALDSQAGALERLLRWEMAGRVRQAAWEAAFAEGRLRQAEIALEASRTLEATVAKRTTAGELARVDLLMARQETLGREVDLQSAQVEARRAHDAYRQLTGADRLPEPLTESPPPTSDAARGTAPVLPPNHPLLADSDGALARARADRKQVTLDRRGHPTLSLGGKRAQELRGEDTLDSLQIEVSMPFGLASQSAPALASAERAYTERLTELHRIRLEAEQALASADIERLGAAEALVVAERRHALAQDALRLMRRAFDLGETDLAELLRAEERAREASMDLELRRLEQGRALARLNQALGVIPE